MYNVAYTDRNQVKQFQKASTNKTKMWHIFDRVPDDIIEQQRIVSDIEFGQMVRLTRDFSLNPQMTQGTKTKRPNPYNPSVRRKLPNRQREFKSKRKTSSGLGNKLARLSLKPNP
jgi:hypothetical protein